MSANWRIQGRICQIGPPYSHENFCVPMSLNIVKTDMNKEEFLYGKELSSGHIAAG